MRLDHDFVLWLRAVRWSRNCSSAERSPSSVFSRVPKVGIEPSSAGVDLQQSAPIHAIEAPVDAPDSPPKRAIDSSVDDSTDDSSEGQGSDGRLPPDALVGVVETALARALELAAEAGRWEIVAQLAEELAARGRGRGNSAPGARSAGSLATSRRSR